MIFLEAVLVGTKWFSNMLDFLSEEYKRQNKLSNKKNEWISEFMTFVVGLYPCIQEITQHM